MKRAAFSLLLAFGFVVAGSADLSASGRGNPPQGRGNPPQGHGGNHGGNRPQPPAIKPVVTPPAIKPVVTPPAIKPVVTPPVIKPVVTPPVIQPVIKPVVQPVIKPVVQPVIPVPVVPLPKVPVHNPNPGPITKHPTNPVVVLPPAAPVSVKPHPVKMVPDLTPRGHNLHRAPVVQPNYRAPINEVYRGRYVPPHRNYFYNRGYWYGGTCYNANPFFTHNTWCPTPWIYYGNSCWFRPGFGYYYSPPAGCIETITVVVEETYTEWQYDVYGQLVPVTQTVVWYYNAFYYAASSCHGYIDCHGQFHWVRW